MKRTKADGTPYVNPNSYSKFINNKALPDTWHRIYRLMYKRIRKHFRKDLGISNPMFDISLERVASIATRLQYLESSDYAEDYKIDINDPKNLKEHNFLTASLNKCMEQVEKYALAKPKVKKKRETQTAIVEGSEQGVRELDDTQIDNRIHQLVAGATRGVKVTTTRTRETEG